jgi:hypothetical protein
LNVATHSIGARTEFKACYGETIEGHSDVRWYCFYEQAKQQHRLFDHLEPWVQECETKALVPATVNKLRTVLLEKSTLRLELAANVDAFNLFVSKCYILEGDGVGLVFCVHQDWLELTKHVAACRTGTALTGTRAVATTIINNNFPQLLVAQATTRVEQLVQEQLVKLEPSFTFFDTKTVELRDQLAFFEAATMFHPLLVQEDGGLAEAKLRLLLPHIARLNKPAVVEGLARELPVYVQECLATPAAPWRECDVEALWHETRFQRLAFWHRSALVVMLAQPSSAPVERFFSMLKSVVDDQQALGLQDYQASGMMTYYNSRERNR